MDRNERVEILHRRVIMLSRDRTQREAYEFAERLEKKKHGERVYKNYNTYKSCISSKRNKKGK